MPCKVSELQPLQEGKLTLCIQIASSGVLEATWLNAPESYQQIHTNYSEIWPLLMLVFTVVSADSSQRQSTKWLTCADMRNLHVFGNSYPILVS